MNLLFDQNLSFKVAIKIRDLFPNAKHISDLRFSNFSDIEIWEFAKDNDYSIVTFDSDFIDISNLNGFPPKIIWLRIGNTSTESVVDRLKKETEVIKEFLSNKDLAFLEIE